MWIRDMDGQVSLFDPALLCGKTSSAPSPAGRARTSGRSLRRSSGLKNHTFMLLDLRKDAGNILGPYWAIDPHWLGPPGTLNTSECPRPVAGSSLSQILLDTVPSRYYLSRKACLVLRRASRICSIMDHNTVNLLRLYPGPGIRVDVKELDIDIRLRCIHIQISAVPRNTGINAQYHCKYRQDQNPDPDIQCFMIDPSSSAFFSAPSRCHLYPSISVLQLYQ